eukprot:TRINITY_DN21523_c0_g1_i6.p1 TRINITY_DN21523_c0_g1~~TRINITY_DN21523_c0_g1_i6.p1  ORF type:complete len:283 (+),score=58.79 TRINITY_DN21523_c0_g1_i6:252-1100(+)
MHPSVTDTIDAVPTTVQIRSGRDSKLPPNLDTDGCALLRSPTSLATHAFYDDATVEAEYYPETCEAVRKHLGAAAVVTVPSFYFPGSVHCLRDGAMARAELAERNQGEHAAFAIGAAFSKLKSLRAPVAGVHTDYDLEAGQFLREHLSAEAGIPAPSRFMLLNAWRNISEIPLEREFLGLCHPRSVEVSDLLPVDLAFEKVARGQHNLRPERSAQHDWLYFPSQTKEELLLFKQWDSRTDLPTPFTFHTGFVHPDPPANAPERQTVELRLAVFWKDKTPAKL